MTRTAPHMKTLAGLLFLFVFINVSFAQDVPAIDKGLALTPLMGWNSWNKFGCSVNEEMIRQMAHGMVKSGMKDSAINT
jgi:alpha-galactosidase